MTHTNMVLSLPVYSSWKKKKEETIWKNSHFRYFRDMSSKSKGAEGEKLVHQFMEKLGHIVSRAKNSDFDRYISGHKTEIKVSTSWDEVEDKFTWQQIRNQEYDRIVFVAINPNDVKFYWASKADLKKYVFDKDEYRQHSGKNGGQELYWLQGVSKMPWFRDIESF